MHRISPVVTATARRPALKIIAHLDIMRRIYCFLGVALLGVGSTGLTALAQTDGRAAFTGTLHNYATTSLKHWTVAWVTTESGTFIKSLRKQGPSWTYSDWANHCGVWNSVRGGSTTLDGYSSATAQDYSGTNSPLVWTWNCRDANNNLVPDGRYKFWIQYAENSGQGPYTTNGWLWTKGPDAASYSYPDLGSRITANSVTWVPVRQPAGPPQILSIRMHQNGIVMSGTGTVSRTYYVLSSADLSAATPLWTPIATNTIDATGNFLCTNAVDTTGPQRYFRLQMQ